MDLELLNIKQIPETFIYIFLAFFYINAVEQMDEVGFEIFYVEATGLYLLVSLVQCLFEWDGYELHVG
jgi:hypothetical protein